ncbi:hypothetical protein Dvina_02925 [Dactylosporangium vinaceum]|uniref:Uncharacterized protein n=1 Tax=Dactylosporangium vinaceum TaxID=53362 RepID=A0ABV5M146_9ACTN|nr:hypothetical protein [Dactylosporangium vinaceum]UAB97172.1 hypothetical protein Dvina_02925 [Dactylosporangium vinaceum]
MTLAELRTLLTAAGLAATIGASGWAFDGLFKSTQARVPDGRAGGLKPLVVIEGSVHSVFDSEDGLFPGHSADITMRVANPNRVAMTITSITPAATAAKVVKAGTTPDDDATRAYCTDRLTVATTPVFAIDEHPAAYRIPSLAEVTIVLRSAVTLNPDTDDRCQRMQFETRWTVAGQNA